jgi:hypothetical protein
VVSPSERRSGTSGRDIPAEDKNASSSFSLLCYWDSVVGTTGGGRRRLGLGDGGRGFGRSRPDEELREGDPVEVVGGGVRDGGGGFEIFLSLFFCFEG